MATLSDLYAHLKTLCEQWFYNKSTIDSAMADKISKSNTSGLVKNDGTIDTNTYLTSASLTGYEQTSNKTSSWNSTTNNTRYPTEKLVKDSLDDKISKSSSIGLMKNDGTVMSGGTGSGNWAIGNHNHTGTYAPNSHTHGNISNDGKVVLSGNQVVKSKLIGANTDGELIGVDMKTSSLTNDGADGTNVYVANNDSRLSDARTPTAHNQATTTITNSETYSNLGTSLTTQKLINDAINTKIGELSSINAIEVVTTKPTASASTMGKLYIVSENSKVNVYYTERSGTSPNYTYSWHKMDTDILDELSINWSDIQNNPFSSASPSDYATSTHNHGDLTSDGKLGDTAGHFAVTSFYGALSHKSKIGNITTSGAIGTTANLPLITTTNGVVTTGSFGSGANTFCEGNDSRLSDARTPTSHNHGNVLNGGTITQTGTSGGNMVVTNSSNSIVVDTTINVIDALIQDLISYGSS